MKYLLDSSLPVLWIVLSVIFLPTSLVVAVVEAFPENNNNYHDHEFQEPLPGFQRGPCPGMNTLANHGYLPRNGINITKSDIVRYSSEVFGVDGAERIIQGVPFITHLDEATGESILDLHDLYRIEDFDSSYSHQDAYFFSSSQQPQRDGDGKPLIKPKDNELLLAMEDYAARNNNNLLTWQTLADWQDIRIKDSLQRNPMAKWNANGVASMAFNAAMLFYLFAQDRVTLATVPATDVVSFLKDNKLPDGFVSETPPRNWMKDPLLKAIQTYFTNRITQSVPLAYLSNNPPLMTDCMFEFQNLQFDLYDYERYQYFFQQDSKVVLPGAGEYVGPKNIEEYVRFADTSSPYLSKVEAVAAKLQFKDVDQETGICRFIQYNTLRLETDNSLAREATYLVGAMTQVVFDYHQKIVPEVHIHYEQMVYDFFFGTLLNNERMYNYICKVSEESCPTTNVGLSHQDCVQQLQDLPLLSEGGGFDGKDYGCRVLHAVFAETNHDHCAHISFEPQEDPNGKIKCQTSHNRKDLDYFDQTDLDDFRDFLDSKRSLMESKRGYKVLSMTPEPKSTTHAIVFGVIIPVVIFVLFYFVAKRSSQTTKDDEKAASVAVSSSSSKKEATTAKKQQHPLFEEKARRLVVIIKVVVAVLLIFNLLAGPLVYYLFNQVITDYEPLPRSFESPTFHHENLPFVAETSPFAYMNDEEFAVFMGFITWGTLLFSGFGLEVFVWYHFTRAWTKKNENLWRFANFSYPLIMITALGLAMHQNYLCLPLVVVGNWQFGFPQTLVFVYLAIYPANPDTTRWLTRVSDFFNAVGLILHHGAVALACAMMVTGVLPPTRWVLNPVIIPTFQHWIIMIAESHRSVYMGLVMVLEYFFQWIIVSDLAQLHHAHWTASWLAVVIVLSHWIMIAGSAVGMCIDEKSTRHNVFVRGVESGEMRNSTAAASMSWKKAPSTNLLYRGSQRRLAGVISSEFSLSDEGNETPQDIDASDIIQKKSPALDDRPSMLSGLSGQSSKRLADALTMHFSFDQSTSGVEV